jgi:chromatin remodeling complex protein RSC6
MPKTKAKKAKRKVNKEFMRPLKPSDKLAVIVGSKSLPRTEVVSKIWKYIKGHKLQDKKNRRMINPDAKLGAVLGSKQISMFKMNARLAKHLN